MISMARLREGQARHVVQPWFAPLPLAQAMTTQDTCNRADRRWPPHPVISPQQPSQLLRPPVAMPAPLPQNQLLDLHCGLMRTAPRPTAALAQSGGSFRLIPTQPLVTRFPTDVKILTQLGQRKPASCREADETLLLFHGRYLVPGHSLKV